MPDLRGLFLRGFGGNSAALGARQEDAIRNITGFFGYVAANLSRGTGAMGVTSVGTVGAASSDRFYLNTGYDFDASRVVPTANENRPVNTAVRYFIRAKM